MKVKVTATVEIDLDTYKFFMKINGDQTENGEVTANMVRNNVRSHIAHIGASCLHENIANTIQGHRDWTDSDISWCNDSVYVTKTNE
mgnify:CR=1 FL=1